MKLVLRQIFAAAAISVSCLYADAPLLKLADSALAAGDYPNAISGYRNAMDQADQKKDPEAWAIGALKLCRTYLRAEDLSNAKAVLAEFRRRHPLRSAGTLPGDLLAAEGKYPEAEKHFAALLASDPSAADAVSFSRGVMKLRAGDLDGAYQHFAALSQGNSPWAAEALTEAVYCLLRSGKIAEAEKFLRGTAEAKRDNNWFTLSYLVDAYSGKTAGLKKNFDAFIQTQNPRPHIRLLELLSKAAAAAEKSGDPDFAVLCLGSALDLHSEHALRKELYRQLINVYAAHFPEKAIAEARIYVKNFPDSADCGQVMNSVGRKLMQNKQNIAAAVELFTEVAFGTDYPLKDRLDAAADALVGSGKLAVQSDPTELFRFLSGNAEKASERSLWHCRFAEYLEKKRNYSEALREYQLALQVAPDQERIHLEMMNFFDRTGNEENMIKEAELLSSSGNMQFQADAKFKLAKVAEKKRDFVKARKYYLESAKVEKSKNQQSAQFLAAQMAYRNNDDAAAAQEFVDFAAKHPASQLAPHALYLALEILDSHTNAELKSRAVKLFQTGHSKHDAWAYYELKNASKKGNNGDLNGAIKLLESLEKDFAASQTAPEISLQKAIFLDKNGSSDQALKIFSRLTGNDKSAIVAAESALYAGEILFRRNEFLPARTMFLAGAKLDPDSLLADVALSRAVDCDLAHSSSLNPEILKKSIDICENLAINTKHPQIRMQALYKLGLCYERSGKYEEAVSAFEKLLYAAQEIDGLISDRQWCIRGTEIALELLVRHRFPGALQRGISMISQLDDLGLKHDGMQKKFRDQLEKIRRK